MNYSWLAKYSVFLLPAMAAISSVAPFSVSAEEKQDQSPFFDKEDGALDMSEWLLDRKGFLPVPIIITEPAVGNGGGAALMFFSQSIKDSAADAQKTGHMTPPDIYGVALAATENDTKFGGAGGMVTFDNDRWRWRGGIGRMDVHLDFYGIGSRFGEDYKVGTQLDGWVSSQQVLYRLGESSNFVAVRWLYLDIDSSFDSDSPHPLLDEYSSTNRDSGLGFSFEHDSRDSIFTPSRGMLAALETLFYDPDIGSDERFQTYRAYAFAYAPLIESIVLGGRLDARLARGDTPFYQVPYIDMRGIAAMRYQGEDVALAEIEARWNVTPRWALIGFVGAGRAWSDDDSFDDVSSKVSKGTGFRYQIARALKLWVGLDYAWGPDDEEAFYIQVGNAWR